MQGYLYRWYLDRGAVSYCDFLFIFFSFFLHLLAVEISMDNKWESWDRQCPSFRNHFSFNDSSIHPKNRVQVIK